jgi:hypothetical protein
MQRAAIVLTAAGALGLSALSAPVPAKAQPWVGPAVVGGLAAGAVIGSGLAASAYGWGPYGYYDGFGPRYYGAYAPAYYGGYAYDYDAPVAYTTTYYSTTTPAYYGYRRVVRPAFAYSSGPRWRHRWDRSYAFYGGPISRPTLAP